MAISDTIQSMYENVGEVYDTITNVPLPEHKNIENIPSTIRESYLEIMNNGTDIVWDNWEKVVGEGTELTLSNTEKAPMKVLLKGNTYQDSTTGKNLIGTNYITGVTINDTTTNDITIRGNWASTIVSNANLLNILEPSTTYTISYKYKVLERPSSFGTNNSVYILGLYDGGSGLTFFGETQKNTIALNTWDTITKTFTTPASLTNYRMIAYDFKDTNNTTTGAIEVSELQIEKGSSATTFETFTYGASPNPDYPQDIHTVSGDNDVEVVGINLFDQETELGGINSITGAETTSTTVIRSKNYIPVQPNTEIYYYNGSENMWVYAYDKNKNFIGYATGSTSSVHSSSATTPNNCYYLRFQCRTQYGTTYKNDICINYSNATYNGHYYPYQRTTYPINLPEGMFLGSIGDYKDTFFKAVEGNPVYDSLDSATKQTLDSNEWYLEKKIGEVVLNGSETWNLQSVTSGKNYYTKINEALGNVNISLYSNLSVYRYFESASSNVPQYSSFISSSKNFNFLASRFNSTSDLKTFLGTTNMILYFVLATPTYTKIEGTLASQLEAVYRAKSKEGQTNISQTNNDLPFELSVSALKQIN